MTNTKIFHKKMLYLYKLEKLGRWLCFEFYRNSAKLQQHMGVHEFTEIFEGLNQINPAWAELLAGGYRFAQFRMLKRSQKNGDVKWVRLGEVVRKGQKSIDGVGDVRAGEVLLYIEVAEKFLKEYELV